MEENTPNSGNDTSPKNEQKNLPKRFFETVTSRHINGGYEVLLDGRAVKTPMKNVLTAPSENIAKAVVEEWDAQKTVIDPATMYLTKMINTACDHVGEHKMAVVDELVTYAGTDMVCYRASEPESLVEAQALKWDPLLSWVAQEYGVRLTCAEGIIHQTQDDGELQVIRDYLLTKSPYFIAGFHALTTLSGSVVVALNCAEGHISVEEAWECAHIDANWQSERWGEDEEALLARHNAFVEFKAAAFLVQNI